MNHSHSPTRRSLGGLREMLVVSCFLVTGALGAAVAAAQEVGRIAAVVNDEVISVMDLSNRARLVVFSTGLPATDEVYQRLMPQILQTMIDERLQLQEAKARDISVTEKEINDTLANMERSNNLPPGGLDQYFAQQNVEKSSLLSQVRANIAWRKLVMSRFQRQAEIGQDEIDEAVRNLELSQGKPRLLVSEIFLAVDDPANEENIRRSAVRIQQQVRQGGRFDELARAFSQNAAAASGGDLGWLVQGQLDDALDDALATMQPGQMRGPIRSTNGYHILLLRDRRLPGGATPDKVTVTLKQVRIELPEPATDGEIRAAIQAAEQIRRTVRSCAQLAPPLPGSAAVGDIGTLRVSDLAEPLRPVVMGLGANQFSAPLRAPQGILLIVVCDRQTEGEQRPDREQIAEQLRLQKLDLLARRYMRDLRSAAYLDVRMYDGLANRANDG